MGLLKRMPSDQDQLAALYLSERDRLQRQINRRVGCPAAACDLVQDIFMRLWERMPLRCCGDPAYLTRCARNAAVDHLRAEKTRRTFVDGLLPDQYAAAPATPQDILQARQGLTGVDAALAALPERTRHVFLLNRIHGRTFAEIAAVMEISERMVAKHMARAMAACQSCLAAE